MASKRLNRNTVHSFLSVKLSYKTLIYYFIKNGCYLKRYLPTSIISWLSFEKIFLIKIESSSSTLVLGDSVFSSSVQDSSSLDFTCSASAPLVSDIFVADSLRGLLSNLLSSSFDLSTALLSSKPINIQFII